MKPLKYLLVNRDGVVLVINKEAAVGHLIIPEYLEIS
jgi:hypothetical protein